MRQSSLKRKCKNIYEKVIYSRDVTERYYGVVNSGLWLASREKTGKMGPSVTAFLVCNAVKAMVVVFTDPSGDAIQRRNCLFGSNSKRSLTHLCFSYFY